MPTGVGVAVHPQLGDTRAAAAPPPFVPTDIAGLVIWLDPSDSATTFQDEAGTVPAVSGDPVDLEDLKIIVLMLFWSLGKQPDALILDELFVEDEDRLIH